MPHPARRASDRASVLEPGAPAAPGGPLPVWVSSAFVAAFLVPTLLVVADPEGVVGLLAYLLGAFGAYVAIRVGLQRNAPSRPLAWRVLSFTPLLALSSMVLRAAFTTGDGVVTTLVPDLVALLGYLAFAAGLLLLLRARSGASLDGAIDAGLMAVSALVVSTCFLVLPLLAVDLLPWTLKLAYGLYPTVSTVVFFLGVSVLLTQVGRFAAPWLFLVGVGSLLLGDVVYALDAAGTGQVPLWVANASYSLTFAFVGAAALHPSMRHLSDPVEVEVRRYGWTRFAGVAFALVAPALVLPVRPLTSSLERWGFTAAFLVLASLVVLRITRAVNEHAATEALLAQRAATDSLTGLANRSHLDTHLEGVLQRSTVSGTGAGVLFMDLDRFKSVNDNWGHSVGDELLVAVAGRLRACLRTDEVVGRVSGDEFLVVLEGLSAPGDAVAVAERVLSTFREPFDLSRVDDVVIAPSIGVSYAPSGSGSTAEDLVREADTAMYRSKADLRSAVTLFDDSMRAAVADRVELERDLRGALGRAEVSLHYQPIVSLETGRVTGFEALMRWTHPERGMVSPAVFIPIAEETRLVVALGRWAVREAVTQLGVWQRSQAPNEVPLTMSVNLSARQLRDPGVVLAVGEVLATTGVDPSTLWMEITESATFEDEETAGSILADLKSVGVNLSADDFGTGYSSLAYLQRYPIDQVKVDRSFVSCLDTSSEARVIVDGVLSLARALSLTVVAEGIETESQRDRLRAMGCEKAQGYLFSRPLPAAAATELVVAAQPLRSAVER